MNARVSERCPSRPAPFRREPHPGETLQLLQDQLARPTPRDDLRPEKARQPETDRDLGGGVARRVGGAECLGPYLVRNDWGEEEIRGEGREVKVQ